jgi:hypothetical protein
MNNSIFQFNRHQIEVKQDHEFGPEVGMIASLFGCWHKELSRPFTHGNSSYISCLSCGARKHFDPDRMKAYGVFYYPPDVS